MSKVDGSAGGLVVHPVAWRTRSRPVVSSAASSAGVVAVLTRDGKDSGQPAGSATADIPPAPRRIRAPTDPRRTSSHSDAIAISKLSVIPRVRPTTSTGVNGKGRVFRRRRNRSPGSMALRLC